MASKLELELSRNIMEVLQEKGLLRDGEALGDFIIMAELPNWKDDTAEARYANILPPDRVVPLHRIVGLIKVCSGVMESDDG